MIELRNIFFSYSEKFALEDFSLQIKSRKFTTLLGTSGSGKTTILRLIAGLEIPRKGEILIDEKIVARNGEQLVPPCERNIGFVFQDLALWPHFNVFENVSFPLKEKGIKSYKEKTKEVLEYLGILTHVEKYPHQLSGGQKQLVAIARALILNPDILLLDEPLANLDVKLKKKIINLILTAKREFNLTVVYVTHDHKEAFSLADDIYLMRQGKIEAKGTTDEIVNSDNEYVKFFLEF